MKQVLFFACFLVVLTGLLQSPAAYGQAVNVTFRIDAATVPDTLLHTDTMQIRGSKAPLTWDNLTGGLLTNSPGGDYWQTTLPFNVGDTIHYKINVKNAAWETNVLNASGLPDDGNRAFIVGLHQDTTLDVQYFNNGSAGRPQFFRPWTAAPDSFLNVYFRVNMQGVSDAGAFSFNKNGDTVAVRGGGPAGADLQWGTSFFLTRESPATNGGFSYDATNFWSARLKFPKSKVHPGDTIYYKYLIGSDWGRDEYQGGHPNRMFKIPAGMKDTTLKYVWYNDMTPIKRTNADTVVVTWRANMATAITNHGFTIGDTVVVQSGFFSTGVISGKQKMLLRQGLSTTYQAVDTIVTSLTQNLDYQYYLIKQGVNYREIYYNFAYAGAIQAEAERRQMLVSSKNLTILDTAASVSVAHRRPNFRNLTKVSQNLTVKFTCDVRPAIYTVKAGKTLTDKQGTINVSNADSIFKWGVAINGPATDTNNTWAPWGPSLVADTNHRMYDDGTHGDLVAHDSIYTRILKFRDTLDIIGQEYKFGIGGGDNEGGYGNNHIQNLDDSQPASTLASQFGSIDPVFYSAWDFDCGCPKPPLSVVEPSRKPLVFSLHQNYPNPFNPSTKIGYTIPSETFVTLKVYNLLGQELTTLVNDRQVAGSHSVTLDASRLPSGVYFYRIIAGSNISTKKMTLMK